MQMNMLNILNIRNEKYVENLLKQDEKWQTNGVLRKGMKNIHHATIVRQDSIEKAL